MTNNVEGLNFQLSCVHEEPVSLLPAPNTKQLFKELVYARVGDIPREKIFEGGGFEPTAAFDELKNLGLYRAGNEADELLFDALRVNFMTSKGDQYFAELNLLDDMYKEGKKYAEQDLPIPPAQEIAQTLWEERVKKK